MIFVNGKPSGAAAGMVRSFFYHDNQTHWKSAGEHLDYISSSAKQEQESPQGYATTYYNGNTHKHPTIADSIEDYNTIGNCQKTLLNRFDNSKTRHILSEGCVEDSKTTSGTLIAKAIRSVRRYRSPWIGNSRKFSIEDSKISLEQRFDLAHFGATQAYLKISKNPVTLHPSGDLESHNKAIDLSKQQSSIIEQWTKEREALDKLNEELDKKYPNICVEKLRERQNIKKMYRAMNDRYRAKINPLKMQLEEAHKEREESLFRNLVRVREEFPQERIDVVYGDNHANALQKLFQERHPEMPFIYLSPTDD